MGIRRPAAISIAAGLLVVAAGTAGLLLTRHSTPAMRPPALGTSTVSAPARPAVSPSAHSASPAVQGALETTPPGDAARPVSITIPLIGVRTSLITLGVEADGSMQVPSSTTVAGWYTGSVLPGDIGPSVIVGHVDSAKGPGVFFRLPQLRADDRVFVTRADGTTAQFGVTSVRTYPKNAFPTQDVFGATPDPELRLVTCGGTFNHATGHYLSNVVVYLTAVS
jgi:sortase (surface protein transpeptidase)